MKPHETPAPQRYTDRDCLMIDAGKAAGALIDAGFDPPASSDLEGSIRALYRRVMR